jgi:ABC-type glycerol-3-phosphate transport system permease component
MSVLEKPEKKDEGRRTKDERGGSAASSASSRSSAGRPPAPVAAPRSSRFARYFTSTGWVHALLLLSVWLFVFPFLWMLGTSVKTDEELVANTIVPAAVAFRPASPYVRDAVTVDRPADAPVSRWKELLPPLTDVASKRVGLYQQSHPALPSLAPFDPAAHRASAASVLVNSAVAKLNKNLWAGDEAALMTEFGALLTDPAVAAALRESAGRLELLKFQLRTLDVHIHNLTDGRAFVSSWQVESGPAKLFPAGGGEDATLLSYDFTQSSQPVVLRYDFRLPAGVTPGDVHKYILSVGADNSWHRFTMTVDVGGRRWQSSDVSYVAQFRPMSLIYQPPTFDDESMRAKNWVSIRDVGPAPGEKDEKDGSPAASSSSDSSVSLHPSSPPAGTPATLRLTLSPSSTPRANLGKALRNYERAFDAVPFWRYIGNSIVLVALCTVGSLFSASFVAYAFARLHWPGRSFAFLLLLSTMMLPGQVTMIPGFLVWRGLNWYNTLNPLWVPAFFGSAFFIFLMVQHMRTIPRELEEAAKLDGLSPVQSWYYVILPNVKPTLAAISILSFMAAWNEFMGPLVYLRDQTKFPLSLGLYGLGLMRTQASDYSWGIIMAGNMLMTIPVILVFFLFQRYFVQGMTMSGMKG